MHSSRQQLLDASLQSVALPIRDRQTTTYQSRSSPEPDYDQDDVETMDSSVSNRQPVYDQVMAYPREPPEAFNEMIPWNPSRPDSRDVMDPDDTDAFRNDPRLVLNVGHFLDEEGHEFIPESNRFIPGGRDSPREQRLRESQDLSESSQPPMFLTQEEVFDMSPRRRSSAFSNIYDPLRRRRSSGRVGLFEPSKGRRSSDHNVNFDHLSNRRRSSAFGVEDRKGRSLNAMHLVPPRRDSVYSVGSEAERVEYGTGDGESSALQFIPEDPLRGRLDSAGTGRYTMRDAVNVARALHLMDEATEDQPLEPAEERPQENDITPPSGFDRLVRRKCWTRYCQSQNYHAHAMRRTGGVTTEDHNRGRIQAHYGKHVTSKISRHMHQTKTWVHFKERVAEIISNFAVWHHSLKHIEGHFGTSIASYFIFVRWLLLLNICIFVIMFGFVVIPYYLKDQVLLVNDYKDVDIDCLATYYMKQQLNTTNADILITDFLQGTGWMETTSMFIGMYDTVTLIVKGVKYNLPLAYLLSALAMLLFSLVIMLRSTAKGFKESVITSEGHLYNYCNTVFGGWDFCISRPEAATLKHEMLITELVSCLEDEKRRRARLNRTRKEQIIIYAIRIIVWLVILSMLGGSGFGIWECSNYALIKTSKVANMTVEANTREHFLALVIEYLPSLVITALNISLPLFFYGLVELEKYSPATVVKVNLFRTLLLRLASVGVLLYSFQVQIKESESCGDRCHLTHRDGCSTIQCWETYVGQQLYKLVLLDFIVIIILTFGVGLLRMILTTKTDFKLFKFFGQEEFDIPKHVLDLVYSQTLCWLGTFFSPLLPAACVIKCLLMFYIKKFHLFVNCIPSRQPYRASKSNAVFITVLLLSFGVFALVPFVYSIAEIKPSRSCGPFRTKHFMWQIIEEIEWPDGFNQVLTIVGSSLFAVPVVILLLLVIYYYHTVSASYKNMSIVLKDHLMMEGKDKQFLLERLNEVTSRMFGQVENQNMAKPILPPGQYDHFAKGDGKIQTANF